MLTTSERVHDEVRRQVVDDYAQKLLNSGYSIESTRKIIIAGLKGYERKLRNSRKEGGSKLLRTAKESYKTRTRKKLLEKTEWFKDSKKRPREDDLSDEDDLPEGWKGNKRKRASRREETKTASPQEEKKRKSTISGSVQKTGKNKEKKIKTRSIIIGKIKH